MPTRSTRSTRTVAADTETRVKTNTRVVRSVTAARQRTSSSRDTQDTRDSREPRIEKRSQTRGVRPKDAQAQTQADVRPVAYVAAETPPRAQRRARSRPV